MADLTHLKNVRAGHKSVLTKKLRDLEDALKATPPDKDTLEQFKVSLQEKLDVLKNLSDQIVAKLQDATEIATEIEAQLTLCVPPFLKLIKYLVLHLQQLLLQHQVLIR